MRYTVIGATGFIGRRLLKRLVEAGHDVFAPGRGDTLIFESALGRVFYCAGMTADFYKQPAATVEAHAGLLSRIIEQAEFEHLVYLSSTRIYDSSTAQFGSEDELLRIDPNTPRHLYDLSKALGENLCLTAATGRAAVARLSCVYDWSPDATGFVSELLQKAALQKSFTVASASGYVRDYIHLDDVVSALLALSKHQASQIVNVASGENISNGDIVALLNGRGWDVQLMSNSERQKAAQCDITRLNDIGSHPRRFRDVFEDWIKSVNASAAH